MGRTAHAAKCLRDSGVAGHADAQRLTRVPSDGVLCEVWYQVRCSRLCACVSLSISWVDGCGEHSTDEVIRNIGQQVLRGNNAVSHRHLFSSQTTSAQL